MSEERGPTPPQGNGQAAPPRAPSFYLTGRQRLSPAAILLAVAGASGALFAILFAMSHSTYSRLRAGSDSGGAGRSAGAAMGTAAGAGDDADDDPTQIDTIVLGDPTEAPVPGRHGDHVSPVHPTIVVRLPRSGDQSGLIPDSATGHLLYDWLAAFNQASYPALARALPAGAAAASAQMQLRRETGGFALLSAKEVQPGVVVFRLQSQTPPDMEALGTLLVRPEVSASVIASFSLRSITPAPADTTPDAVSR